MRNFTLGYQLLILSALTLLSVRAEAAGGREKISLDAGWRFQLGDTKNENENHIAEWQWRAINWNRNNEPNRMNFETQGRTAPFKNAAIGEDTFHGQQGFHLYQTILPILRATPESLHFESVDDNATIYLNGQKLLHHEGWDEPFDVLVGTAWNTDKPNILDVVVENTNGGGGIGETTIQSAQPVADIGTAAVNFNDAGWRTVHLPHDFVVEGTFTPKSNPGHGSLPTGIGWYRRTLDIPASDRGRKLSLDFDGVYRNSKVWLNGKLLGNHLSGYTGFSYDITDAANYGGKNVIVVRADAKAQEGWWYEGGGIYRHVWLSKTSPIHVAQDGVFVTTKVLADGSAVVSVKIDFVNQSGADGEYSVLTSLKPQKSKQAVSLTKTVKLLGNGRQLITITGTLPRPQLWSIETPTLYDCTVAISKMQSGANLDSITVPFGIRTIRFDAEKGFFLNGKPVKIQGTCNHQDFVGVGIAMPDSLLEWRIKKLKEMGCNAYRMSHNPPAKELIDACDRLGMLVMDENRHLGDTYRDHSPHGTKYDDLSDLRSLILRDRNHPSIIMWSMCNEEGLQGSPEGARIFAAMKKATLELDPTRPITCAMNGGWGEGISLVEDLQGCNYNPLGYDNFHKTYPDRPAYGSETASAVSTRGEYRNDPVKGYVSAYDVNAPDWAQPAEVAWKALAERPFMAGGYVWTGFDYKGEPTPYGWPCINSHFGIMDICGFPKDTYYYYLSWWGSKPVVHLLPHWNWPGMEGKDIDVWCHSNADRVELFLNGKSLGAKDMPRFSHLEWKVPYSPGRLEARGYRNGKLIASDVVETTGAPSQIRLTTEQKSVKADGEEVMMVTATVLDAKGRVVPFSDDEISFSVSGNGSIAGVGNGDPSSHEPDKASKRRAFHGLCMVVVQAGEKAGAIELTANAAGLKTAHLGLEAK